MRGQITDAAHLPQRPEVGHGQAAHNQEAEDRHHFDQGEPELEFTVVLHIEEVDTEQNQGRCQHKDIDADRWKPAVEYFSGNVCFPRHQADPVTPVQPPNGKTGPATNGAVGVGRE
ncbi:hypothetical protein D3C79_835140 [compost metagenome]